MAHSAAAAQTTQREKRDLLGPEVGRRIREVRTKRGMSLARVGGDDLSRSFLSLVESGRSRISLRALAIVAERLETPIGTFFEDEDSGLAAEIALDFAEIELERGKPEEAIRTIREGAASYASDPSAQWILGRALAQVNEYEEAVAVLRQALELADSHGDVKLAAEILYSLGRTLYVHSNYDDALASHRLALEKALQAPDDVGLLARLHISIGHCLYVLNRPDDALAQYERAQELLGSLYDLAKMGSVFSAMSLASRKSGDLDSALRYSKRSVATYRLKRDWRLVALEMNNMADRYKERHELDAAATTAREAIRVAHDARADDVEALAHSTLAAVYLQTGNVTEAAEEAAAAERLAPDDAPLPVVDAWVVQAEIAAGASDWSRADHFFRKAIARLAELNHRTRLNETALRYSQLLKERGDLEAALEMAMEAANANVSQPGDSSAAARTNRTAG